MKHPVKSCILISFLLLPMIPAISETSDSTVMSVISASVGFQSSVENIGSFLDSYCIRDEGSRQAHYFSLEDFKLNLETSTHNILQENRAHNNLDEFFKVLKDTENFYNTSKESYKTHETKVSNINDIMFEGSEQNFSKSDEVAKRLLRSLHKIVEDTADSSFLNYYERLYENGYRDTCFKENNEGFPQQYILQIFYRIICAEMQVQYIMKSSAEISKLHNEDSNMKTAEEELMKYHNSIMARFKRILEKMPRDIWRCDPLNHVKDTTYSELHVIFDHHNMDEGVQKCKLRTDWSFQRGYNFTENFFTGDYVTADTPDYVVIGARIMKKEGVIYLAIQQGQLLPEGKINESTISWKEPTSEQLNDPSNKRKIDCLRRYVDLTSVEVPRGHILTGLRFNFNLTNHGRQHLSLAVASLPFNITSGKMIVEENMKNTETYPDPAKVKSSLDIKYCPTPNSIYNSNRTITDEYLEIKNIGDKIRNILIGAVPFIDIQNVTTETPTLMGGAGLYFKYYDDCKGYLALRMILYDFSQHINYE